MTKKLTKGNVPNLRFPGFEGEWELKKVGDLMDFKVTNSFSRDNLNYDSGIVKNIHYGDIHTKFQTLFNITNEIVPFINEEINIDKISDENYCKEGDLVFADASEDLNDVGKSIEIINLNNEKLLSGLHTLLARPKENIFTLGFNGYLFKSNQVRTQIQKEAQGSKVLSINVGRISKIELSFPAKNEQEKITALLSLLDERIQTQSKIIKQLETLMRGFREKVFKKELIFKGNSGNPFSEWRVDKLENWGTFFSGGTPLTTTKHYYDGIIPFIKSGEIHNDYTEQFISEEGLKNSSAKLVDKGDLLYALYGATSGEVAISKIKGAINQAILCIKTELNTNYLLNYLIHQKENIIKTYLQGGQGNLSAEIIKAIKIPIPSKEEQNLISNVFSSINQKIETEKAILEQLEKQKKYLLQQMFI